MNSAAILNTGINLKLNSPQENEYWNEELVGYIIRMDGKSKLRIVTSWGSLRDYDLGSRHEFHADQSGRRIGFGEVIGIYAGDLADSPLSNVWDTDTRGLALAPGIEEKDIPNNLSHWVFK